MTVQTLFKNWLIERAKWYCRRQDFAKAGAIVDRLLERFPGVGALEVFRADLFLFERKFSEAKDMYSHAWDNAVRISPMADENRLYLLSYIDFRRKAIECHEAGRAFENWQGDVDDLPTIGASKSNKRLLPFP